MSEQFSKQAQNFVLFSRGVNKQKVNKIKPANVLLVQVLNNPFEFSTQSKMIFYINGTPLYKDIFKIQFPVTINLNDKELVHCRIEIIEGDCLYVFEDKSVFNWDVNFKFIYAAFFPDNSTTDNIHFFPQQQLVVQ